MPEAAWCTLGFTYDGAVLRAYLDGVLDAREPDPEPDRRTDPYFTQEGPDGGNRGMNPYYHGRGIFRYDPVAHGQSKPGGGSDFTVGARYAVGSMLGEATLGRFAGLAVFNRALTEAEMMRLHRAARIESLPRCSPRPVPGGAFGARRGPPFSAPAPPSASAQATGVPGACSAPGCTAPGPRGSWRR